MTKVVSKSFFSELRRNKLLDTHALNIFFGLRLEFHIDIFLDMFEILNHRS